MKELIIDRLIIMWFIFALMSAGIMLIAIGIQCYTKGPHAKVPTNERKLINVALVCLAIPILNIYKAAKYLAYVL